jgi:hypothetical protein
MSFAVKIDRIDGIPQELTEFFSKIRSILMIWTDSHDMSLWFGGDAERADRFGGEISYFDLVTSLIEEEEVVGNAGRRSGNKNWVASSKPRF